MSYLNRTFLKYANFIIAHPINKPRKKKLIDKTQIGIINLCSKGQKLRYVMFEFEIVKIEKNIINGNVRKNEKTFVKFLMRI